MPDDLERDVDDLMDQEPASLRRAVVFGLRGAIGKPPEQTHAGPLPNAERESGHKIDPARREFLIGTTLAAVLGLSNIALSVEAIRETRKESREARNVASEGRLAIRREFADHIAGVNYRSPNPLAGYQGPTLTEGEWAVHDSMVHLRDRKIRMVEAADRVLRRAIDASTDPHGKAIGLSRLAIDESFRGNGPAAESALAEVPFVDITSKPIIVRLTDFGTSVALNSIDPRSFQKLESRALRSVEVGWASLSIDAKEPSDIASLSAEYGVGIFAIAQRAGIAKMKDALTRGKSGREARDYWPELIKQTAYALNPEVNTQVYGEDMLYSLHRPTFHAAADGQHDQVRSMLSYYLNPSPATTGFEASLNAVRDKFRREMPGSSPWMFLLEVAYEEKRDDARAKLRNIATLAKTQPPQFMKALASMWTSLRLEREELMRILAVSETSIGFPPITIHRAYMNLAGRSLHF